MGFSTSGIETIRDPLLLQIKNKELGDLWISHAEYAKITYSKWDFFKAVSSLTFIAISIIISMIYVIAVIFC